jgi:hypothetical protein
MFSMENLNFISNNTVASNVLLTLVTSEISITILNAKKTFSCDTRMTNYIVTMHPR